MTERFVTNLNRIAKQVPLGFECRSCGGSAYNWLMKIDRYMETGEPCCANFRDWCRKADAADAAAVAPPQSPAVTSEPGGNNS